ncbi:MAG TPA: MgtC/SapB family protein [Anaerolineae bacterium]|nr:MgtC/SapB family protein [Anaerolineae bacterium]
MILEEDIIKLLLAVVAGGLIGAEREFRDKAAGFRTIIFICIGATIFTILSTKLGAGIEPARIAASIVSGVGFLGAGVILRDRGQIMGLTTASTIWLAAALGMAIGSGEYMLAGGATLIILVVLWIFPFIEFGIDNLRHTLRYEITCAMDSKKPDEIQALLKDLRLRVDGFKTTKTGDQMRLRWEARGSPKRHKRLMDALFADPDIKNLHF